MTPHGPDTATFENAVKETAEVPGQLSSTLTFMFEVRVCENNDTIARILKQVNAVADTHDSEDYRSSFGITMHRQVILQMLGGAAEALRSHKGTSEGILILLSLRDSSLLLLIFLLCHTIYVQT